MCTLRSPSIEGRAETERERERERERESQADSTLTVQRPTQGSISQPQDHDLSQHQQSDAHQTEPPTCPRDRRNIHSLIRKLSFTSKK